MPDMYFILMYVVLGALTGVLSGLLGIGGGVLIVPGLLMLFSQNHFLASKLMHLAAGTSFAIMVPTTIRALMSHLKHKIEIRSFLRWLWPGTVLGVVCGAILAHFLHSDVLRMIFAISMVLMAIKLLLPSDIGSFTVKERYVYPPASFLIGFFAAMLGIGGSTFLIPLLLACKVEMRVAIVLGTAVACIIAFLSCLLYIVTGWHEAGLPLHALGYFYWPAALCVMIGSVLLAPLGVKLSHRISQSILRKFFAVFLLVVAVHVFMVA